MLDDLGIAPRPLTIGWALTGGILWLVMEKIEGRCFQVQDLHRALLTLLRLHYMLSCASGIQGNVTPQCSPV